MNALGANASFTNPPRPCQMALTWTFNNHTSSELVHLITNRLPFMTDSQVEALYYALSPIGLPFSLGSKAVDECNSGILRTCKRCDDMYYEVNNTRVACKNGQRHTSNPMAQLQASMDALFGEEGSIEGGDTRPNTPEPVTPMALNAVQVQVQVQA